MNQKYTEINELLQKVQVRESLNDSFLHLTINENQISKTANSFLNSKLSERYYFGGGKDGLVDFNPFTFVGMPEVELLVKNAEEALKEMSGGSVVNLDCLSGVHAMMCALLATTKPGETVMTVDPNNGGHFATKGILEAVGRKQIFAEYDNNTLLFKPKELAEKFKKHNAKVFYIDASNYIKPHNLQEIRDALGDEAIIIYDASHTMGLILGGEFQSPFNEGADIITANTHKTLAGPQKGLIIFKDEKLGNEAQSKILGTLYSSNHVANLIALAITILEWKEFGVEYAQQVISNAQTLSKEFENLGYEVRKLSSGEYTQNEQVHVFIDEAGDRLELYKRLVDNNISVNFHNAVGGRTFARIGTQEITRRGMNSAEMKEVAKLVDQALKGSDVREDVVSFNSKFDSILYSFDK
jgi:glycine/serine hydroxymethyltransferase